MGGEVVSGDAMEGARRVDRLRRGRASFVAEIEKEARPDDSDDGGDGEGETEVIGGGMSVFGLVLRDTAWPATVGPIGNVNPSSSDTAEVCVEVGLIISCVFASIAASFSSAVADALSEVVEVRRWSGVSWLSVEELGSSKLKTFADFSAGLLDGDNFVGLFLKLLPEESEVLRLSRKRSTPRRTVLRREPLRLRPWWSSRGESSMACGRFLDGKAVDKELLGGYEE